MKRILFNDKFGLTKAVLEGRKTMTRRVFKGLSTNYDRSIYGSLSEGFNMMCSGHVIFRRNEYLYRSTFKVGEVVAVAQSYEDASLNWINMLKYKGEPGWKNKMFVRADLMPHQIRITNVRVERLQDISDEDVYKEGFTNEAVNNGWGNYAYHYEAMLVYYDRLGRSKEIRSRVPREAYAALIDRVCGKGTWDKNPWVFVYEFELVK